MSAFVKEYVAGVERFQDELLASGVTTDLKLPAIALNEQKQWTSINWSFSIQLSDGLIFDGLEIHRQQKTTHSRKVKYRLRSDEGGLIFMVDSHGGYADISECPHLHTGSPAEMRLMDGAWELNGLSLEGFYICDMWKLVDAYRSTGRHPWRTR